MIDLSTKILGGKERFHLQHKTLFYDEKENSNWLP